MVSEVLHLAANLVFVLESCNGILFSLDKRQFALQLVVARKSILIEIPNFNLFRRGTAWFPLMLAVRETAGCG